jgi:hypothetical protein
MADPVPGIDFANLPLPNEGILVTLCITVRKVARSVLRSSIVRGSHSQASRFGRLMRFT